MKPVTQKTYLNRKNKSTAIMNVHKYRMMAISTPNRYLSINTTCFPKHLHFQIHKSNFISFAHSFTKKGLLTHHFISQNGQYY